MGNFSCGTDEGNPRQAQDSLHLACSRIQPYNNVASHPGDAPKSIYDLHATETKLKGVNTFTSNLDHVIIHLGG